MENQIKVAFIGAGYMAEEHIKAFSDITTVALLGIHSRNSLRAESLAKKYGIPKVYESIDALYNGTLADLVIIAVPELSTNKVCKDAFSYPWRALIEKPVGYNLADAEDIAAAAHASSCKAYVALNRRHYSSTRAVLRELSDIHGHRLVQVFDQENPIAALEGGQPRLVVDNWMYANSIHLVDYLSVFCRGDVTSIDHVIRWDSTKPGFVLTKFEYSSGDIGLYHAIWNGPGPWIVNVTTQAKRWEMRPLEQASSQLPNSRKSNSLPVHEWDIKFKPGLRLQAQEACKALRGEENTLATLAVGIETMKLVSLIYEA